MLFVICYICIRPSFLSHTVIVLGYIRRVWGKRNGSLFPVVGIFLWGEGQLLGSQSSSSILAPFYFVFRFIPLHSHFVEVQLLSLKDNLETNTVFTRHWVLWTIIPNDVCSSTGSVFLIIVSGAVLGTVYKFRFICSLFGWSILFPW